MLVREVLLFLVLAGLVHEGHSLSRHKRIIGGQVADEGEWPWLVSLHGKFVTKKLWGIFPIAHKHSYCGGSVINDRWILTAAHCFYDSNGEKRKPRNWKARLASVSLKEHLIPQASVIDEIKNFFGKIFDKRDWQHWEIDVDRIVLHPKYSDSSKDLWEHDIALVRLKKAVPSGETNAKIRRIVLPSGDSTSFPGVRDYCVTKGWGCTRGGFSVSGHARSVRLPIYNRKLCAQVYGKHDIGKRICAGYLHNGKGICRGDSGGPLTCKDSRNRWIQVGIASFSSKHHPESFPAVFTRVSAYIDWIKSILMQAY